ncbi:Fur family ferric uptake transcriptional regulator [Inquilinus ginsengisoli]|uniref:Fur family ferric uptake transcriptional regulator n=1 Tax=Inquilinus ginsengisoli TaxID=363840 RepID=A0ABU1JZ21_9PROT|nr:transcriptional repressor [Inquilinus ginsengisoli]MDR6293872.1 Fur family ferric uptake transcriptional regulator [Inquilinus ginsengisoli]
MSPAPALPIATLSAPAEARLRDAGLRPTRPRRILLAVLAEAERALDAQEILGRARRLDPRISLATVYRFLAALRRVGIAGWWSEPAGRLAYGPVAVAAPPERLTLGDVQLRAALADVLRQFGYRLIRARVDLAVERLHPEAPLAEAWPQTARVPSLLDRF